MSETALEGEEVQLAAARRREEDDLSVLKDRRDHCAIGEMTASSDGVVRQDDVALVQVVPVEVLLEADGETHRPELRTALVSERVCGPRRCPAYVHGQMGSIGDQIAVRGEQCAREVQSFLWGAMSISPPFGLIIREF